VVPRPQNYTLNLKRTNYRLTNPVTLRKLSSQGLSSTSNRGTPRRTESGAAKPHMSESLSKDPLRPIPLILVSQLLHPCRLSHAEEPPADEAGSKVKVKTERFTEEILEGATSSEEAVRLSPVSLASGNNVQAFLGKIRPGRCVNTTGTAERYQEPVHISWMYFISNYS
jgi:hypothetical protein